MLERKPGVLLSARDSAFFREPVIPARFRAEWRRSCPIQTPVSSEIFSGIFGSRARRVGILGLGEQQPYPTVLQLRQQGCRTAEGKISRGGSERFFRAVCSSFLNCKP